MIIRLCLCLFFAAILSGSAFAAGDTDYLHAQAAIQVASTISDGKYTVSEIASVAEKKDIDVVILADRDMMKWEYGVWPLRRIIKKTVEKNSIFKYGIKKYLSDVREAQKANPGVILIPGIESAPFYYWSGNIFDRTFKIADWHKHLILVGLDEAVEIENLPIVGNPKALSEPFKPANIFLILWPLLFICAGAYMIFIGIYGKDAYDGRLKSSMAPGALFIAVSLVIVGIAALVYNHPFRNLKFDPYGDDRGIMPYQNMIDYVNKCDGMAFWAHVEASNVEQIGAVSVETRSHVEILSEARDYSGFCVFPDGYDAVGRPGGMWDRVLNEYCEGSRRRPVWAIAGAAYDYVGKLENFLESSRTSLLVRHINKDEALEAMRRGRMYAARGKAAPHFMLSEFSVEGADESGKTLKKISGEELVASDKGVMIRIKGCFNKEVAGGVKITVIKGGNVINVFDAPATFDIEYCDTDVGGDKTYYRIEISAKDLLVVSNPVFVRRR